MTGAGPRRRGRLVVLAKPPLPGRAKSRLARAVGEGAAARLARAMLRDTWRAVDTLCAGAPELDARLAVTGPREAYPLLLPEPVTVPQGGGDLGQRMARAAVEALAHGDTDRVLLLGTDCTGLPPTHVRRALALLDEAPAVLGPLRDGGFWCLGLRADAAPLRDPRWLDALPWDRDATRGPVLERLAALGLRAAEAPSWFDVDHGADLERLEELLADAPERAPAVHRELTALRARRDDREPHADAAEPGAAPLLSVVVATLDEGRGLDACLDALAEQPGPVEVVVSDGGSGDGSAERAAARPDVVVCRGAPGRGQQLRAGAALATGERLLFLHVDVRLPPDATRHVDAALADGRFEAGAFVTHTVADPDVPDRAGPLLRLADVRSRITRLPYGDQALFVTRRAYEAVGGFRPIPLMEDLDLSRRLARRGRLARVRAPVQVSGRRIQTHPLRSALLFRTLPLLWRLGVSPERLARFYRG